MSLRILRASRPFAGWCLVARRGWRTVPASTAPAPGAGLRLLGGSSSSAPGLDVFDLDSDGILDDKRMNPQNFIATIICPILEYIASRPERKRYHVGTASWAEVRRAPCAIRPTVFRTVLYSVSVRGGGSTAGTGAARHRAPHNFSTVVG